MSHLPLVTLEQAEGPLQAMLLATRERMGFLPNAQCLWGLRPVQALKFFADDGLYKELMNGPSALTPAEREMIGVAISVANGCKYCTASHSAYLRQKSGDPAMADAVRADYRTAPLSPRQKAMIDYAVKVARRPKAVSKTDMARLRKHGFTDADIMDMTQVAAIFSYTNRVASALDLEPNPEFEALGR